MPRGGWAIVLIGGPHEGQQHMAIELVQPPPVLLVAVCDDAQQCDLLWPHPHVWFWLPEEEYEPEHAARYVLASAVRSRTDVRGTVWAGAARYVLDGVQLPRRLRPRP